MSRNNAYRRATRAIEQTRSIKLEAEGSNYATKTREWREKIVLLTNDAQKLLTKFTDTVGGYKVKAISHWNDITRQANPLSTAAKVTKKNELQDINDKALVDIKSLETIIDKVDLSLNQVLDWENLMRDQLNNWTGLQTDYDKLSVHLQNTVADKTLIIAEKDKMTTKLTSAKDIKADPIDINLTRAIIIIGQLQAAGSSLTLTGTGTFIASWDGVVGDLKADWNDTNHVTTSKLFNFTKNNMLDSSEKIRQNKRLSQMKTLNTRNNNYNNKNFSMMGGVIQKINSHQELINMKYGNGLINKDCRDVKNLATNLYQSISTYEDLSKNIRLDGGGTSALGYQTNFPINGKRSAIGLLSEPSRLDTNKRHVMYSLKNKIKKIIPNKCENPNVINKELIAEPHKNIHEKEIHNHYFPISGKAYGQYNHQHNTHPHDKNGVPPHFFQHFTFRYAKNPRNINET